MNHQTSSKAGASAVQASTTPRLATSQIVLLFVGYSALLIIATASITYWLTRPAAQPPKVNDPLDKILAFIGSSEFNKQPFDRRAMYLGTLENRKSELLALFDAGSISEKKFKEALNFAWFGKQIAQMDDYRQKPEVQREKMLQDEAEDEYWENHWEKSPSSRPSGYVPRDPRHIRGKELDRTFPLTWPTENKMQWDEYRKAARRAERRFEEAQRSNPQPPPKRILDRFRPKVAGRNNGN